MGRTYGAHLGTIQHTCEEIRIVLAPYHTTCILVNGVVRRNKFGTQIGQRQERGRIGIVHKQMGTESIHLKGIYLAIPGMLYGSMLLQSLTNIVGNSKTFLCHCLVVVYLGEYNCRLAQHALGKEVAGNEEREYLAIVRGTEGTGYHATMLGRMPIAIVAGRIVKEMRGALELVTGLWTAGTLLLTEKSQNLAHSLLPQVAKDTGVACQQPILVCQTYGIAK